MEGFGTLLDYLAVGRLVDVIHPASLGERLECREVEAPDLHVGHRQEVVFQDEIHFFAA